MLRLAAGLALLMGFCDVVTLIRFRVFAAMLTGNLLFVGERLGPPYDEAELDGVVYRLAVCLSHLLGAFFYCMLRDRCTARATLQILTPSLPALLLIGDLLSQHTVVGRWGACGVAASLGATSFLGSPADPFANKASEQLTMASFDAAALTRRVSASSAVTYAATGHLHKLVALLHKRLTHGPSVMVADAMSTLYTSLAVVCCLLLGAAVGGIIINLDVPGIEAWLLVPAAALQFALLYSATPRTERRGLRKQPQRPPPTDGSSAIDELASLRVPFMQAAAPSSFTQSDVVSVSDVAAKSPPPSKSSPKVPGKVSFVLPA